MIVQSEQKRRKQTKTNEMSRNNVSDHQFNMNKNGWV